MHFSVDVDVRVTMVSFGQKQIPGVVVVLVKIDSRGQLQVGVLVTVELLGLDYMQQRFSHKKEEF